MNSCRVLSVCGEVSNDRYFFSRDAQGYTSVVNDQATEEREHLFKDCWCGHGDSDHGAPMGGLSGFRDAASRSDSGLLPVRLTARCRVCDRERA
jgi:hypothetical protein